MGQSFDSNRSAIDRGEVTEAEWVETLEPNPPESVIEPVIEPVIERKPILGPEHPGLVRLAHMNKFWGQFYNQLEGESVIVAGVAYTIGPEPEKLDRPNCVQYGFGGRRHAIQFFSDNREVVTHNLWYRGPVPPELRVQMPDNARFIQ